jgi:hypothetical protein
VTAEQGLDQQIAETIEMLKQLQHALATNPDANHYNEVLSVCIGKVSRLQRDLVRFESWPRAS